MESAVASSTSREELITEIQTLREALATKEVELAEKEVELQKARHTIHVLQQLLYGPRS